MKVTQKDIQSKGRRAVGSEDPTYILRTRDRFMTYHSTPPLPVSFLTPPALGVNADCTIISLCDLYKSLNSSKTQFLHL